jgi:hypothetical protein
MKTKTPTVKSDKSTNDRFKAIRTATMGDEEIAAEVVPRSAYELQALAIHARNQALIAAEVVPRSGYERQAWRYMPKTMHARNQSFDSCRGGAKECV